MLSPKRSKYRKAHKGRVHGLAKGGTTLNFGAYGLKASICSGRITARQIEAARRAITRYIRRAGLYGSASSRMCRSRQNRPSRRWWRPRRRMEFTVAILLIMFQPVEPANSSRWSASRPAKLPVATRFIARAGDEAVA